MPTPIRITIGPVALDATLDDTPCADAIADLLPLHAPVHEWGEEFYFHLPVEMGADGTATMEVEAGDIGFWPPGPAVAIFFGPTPLSAGDRPVPASPVNLVGRVNGDPQVLRAARGKSEIRIDRR
ncbi:MAG: hypothetical protein LUP93_05565 [Methanomicrobiales archaeon]|jgi:hypothetical protein|nr:hypothetical protein [Methanomicrobiales archaeon]MDD1647490.1 hypothetical protein [Methanomicrobiales archaeon]